MRAFDFDLDSARRIDAFGSHFSMARLVHNEHLHVGCMYLPPRGRVGYHSAAGHQLFAVVQGHGWTRTGEGERVEIECGQAVLWEPGEMHEAGTETGMMVMVIEGDVVSSSPEEIGPVSQP